MSRTYDIYLQDIVETINRLYKEHNYASDTQMD